MSRIAEPSSSETQATKPQQQRTHSKLVQRLLDASASLPQFLNDLLTTQAVVVAGTEAAAFLVGKQGEQIELRLIAHIRPDDSDAETRAAAVRAFQNIVQPCVQQSKDGAISVGSPDGGEEQYCLVTILRNEGEVVAVSAVVTRCRDQERAKQRLTSMQLVAGYFELYSLRRLVEQSRIISEQHQGALQYAGAVGTAEGFESSAMNLCNELATRTGATRVAVGWVKGKQIKLKALSHTEKFDKKQELVVQLEKVMEECLDQEEPVRFDPAGDSSQNVTRSARELSERQGGTTVLSMPLRNREDIVGILTLEFPPQVPLQEQTENGVSVAAELLAPQLYDRYQNDRYIFTKMAISFRELIKHAIGPRFWTVKLVVLAIVAAGLFVWLYKPMYRVKASFVLNPVTRQTLCAAYEGKLEAILVKPGVPVKKGQVLGRLETRERKLAYEKARKQVETKNLDANRALGENKLWEAIIAQAERDAAQKEADLLNYEIQNAEMKAPFDGILISKDLTEMRGKPVNKGDPLFEVAEAPDPANPRQIAIEAEVHVPERDIQEVDRIFNVRQADPAGKARLSGLDYDGEISTTSFPNLEHRITITRVVPAGEPKEGENVFKVFASIDKPEPWMYAGLAGQARINIQKQPLWWIWTHRLTDWLRLYFWL